MIYDVLDFINVQSNTELINAEEIGNHTCSWGPRPGGTGPRGEEVDTVRYPVRILPVKLKYSKKFSAFGRKQE